MTVFADARYNPRTCPTCGGPVTGHYTRKYCSRACAKRHTRHAARARARAAYVQDFIGVDGEGVNLPDGTHRYVMLSVGDETLYNNGDELTHREIFPFLYQCYLAGDRRLAYVGFYLGYDFTLWTKSMSEHEGSMLFSPDGVKKRQRKVSPVPQPVYVDRERWEVDMLGMKRFKLRPHAHHGKNQVCGCGWKGDMPESSPHDWLVICDVGSFFQTAFVNVLRPDGWRGEAPCTQAEYDTIVVGKANRSNAVTLEDQSWVEPMMEYNRLENRILASVMRIYNAGFSAMGVKLNRTQFFGPGQAAQQWLGARAREGKFITHDDIESVIPLWVLDKWRSAYYGGRFEIFYHGIVPGVAYEYDIQSAYPDSIRALPCLCAANRWHDGCWAPNDLTDAQKRLTLVYGTITGRSERIGALPHRTAKGAIVYPTVTRGWYRLSELEAAYAAGLVWDTLIERVIYPETLCGHDAPLASLAELFAERLRVGKATPHGKALKLVYNSVYGKFAQSVGSPRFANPLYAAMITSDCRIRILESIRDARHPDDTLLMIATDGVYYSDAIPGYPTVETNVEQLGAWECGVKENLTLFKPGVYWDDAARQAISQGKSAALKARGISAAALQEHILTIDADFQAVAQGVAHRMPEIVLNTPFSIASPQLALARGKWHTSGHVEYDMQRTDRAVIGPKRYAAQPCGQALLESLVPTVDPIDSAPYERSFGYDLDGLEDLTDDLYTPDGLAIETVQVAIRDLGVS